MCVQSYPSLRVTLDSSMLKIFNTVHYAVLDVDFLLKSSLRVKNKFEHL